MIEISLIILTIFLSALFSGSEVAFVSSNRLKLEIESRKGSWTGQAVSNFIQNPDRFLSTVLVGKSIANVAYATLMTLFLFNPLQQWYFNIIGSEPSLMVLILILVLITGGIILLVGEILPQTLCRVQADRWMKMVALPQQLFHWLFKPFMMLGNAAANTASRMLQKSEPSDHILRDEDVELIFKESREIGGKTLDKEDSEILQNVLELSNKRVKESMIPRTDIIAVEKSTSIDETLKRFISSGFSKLPIYQESIDDIIGVIFAYDLFSNPRSLAEITRPVKLVPVSKKSKDLLSEFRKSNISVAIVIDEYGGTAGMVTIEDLLEEVVGDIQDEYDTEDHFVKKLSENTYILSGGIEIEDLLEEYPAIKFPIESDEYETVAGYIINTLGRIPKVNEELLIDGNKIIISKATSSRIETVKLVTAND